MSTPTMKRSDVKRALQIAFIARQGHFICLADEPDVLARGGCSEVDASGEYAEEVLGRDPIAVARWLIPDPEPEKTYRLREVVRATIATTAGTDSDGCEYVVGDYLLNDADCGTISWPKEDFEKGYEEVPA